MSNRDDFPQQTSAALAKRAAFRCSVPWCRAQTSGPSSDPQKSVSVGRAAHICAAAPNGPRYDPAMTREERISAENGIWVCANHSDHIDKDTARFTVLLLRSWKEAAEKEADELLGKPSVAKLALPRSPFAVPLEYQLSALRQTFDTLRRENQLRIDVKQLSWALKAGLRDGVNYIYEPLTPDRVADGLDELSKSGGIEIESGIIVLKPQAMA